MSEWIRTSERLPSNSSIILVLLDQRPYFGYFIPKFRDFRVSLEDDSSDYFHIDRIKYWMPIPRVPEDA
jgi:hypothetical protein